VTELPDPKPLPDQYLIEVHAAATNFFDILQIQGKYQNQPRTFLTLSPPSFLAKSLSFPPPLMRDSSFPLDIRGRVLRRRPRDARKVHVAQVPRRQPRLRR
jgi:hypothetical protein